MPSPNLQFYAHAKLLISGEYLILRGATGLAIPLRFGQSLSVESKTGEAELVWSAYAQDNLWMWARFGLPNLELYETNHPGVAESLQQYLLNTQRLNPLFLTARDKIEATSHLNFPPQWGIGSGSSLIANMARWAGVDPYQLNTLCFSSSGYDIAAALSDTPVLFRREDERPVSQPVSFSPDFAGQLWFIYLNRKQNSLQAVRDFAKLAVSNSLLEKATDLSLKMAHSEKLPHFCALMEEHESLIGSVLNSQPVKERLFFDFEGSVKSLGAWGGDFILAATTRDKDYVTRYFSERGYPTIFNFREMIYQ